MPTISFVGEYKRKEFERWIEDEKLVNLDADTIQLMYNAYAEGYEYGRDDGYEDGYTDRENE